MDPYRVLGIPRDADEETIKKAYKALAKTYHPDLNKSPDASDRFKEINAAWDVLKDPGKRKMYDTYGSTEGPPPAGPGGFPGGAQGFSDLGGIDVDDLLSSMFGAGSGFRRDARGRDQQASLELDPLMAILGGESSLSLGRPGGARETIKVRIPPGARDGGTLRLKGQGLPPPSGGPAGDLILNLKVPEHPRVRRVEATDLEMDLPVTVGEALRGAEIVLPTPTGEVKVKVPKGARSGQRLRLKGRGVPKPGKAGDLYLVVRPALPDGDGPEVQAAIDVLERAYRRNVREDIVF
jgi:curved DNA-binding protein